MIQAVPTPLQYFESVFVVLRIDILGKISG